MHDNANGAWPHHMDATIRALLDSHGLQRVHDWTDYGLQVRETGEPKGTLGALETAYHEVIVLTDQRVIDHWVPESHVKYEPCGIGAARMRQLVLVLEKNGVYAYVKPPFGRDNTRLMFSGQDVDTMTFPTQERAVDFLVPHLLVNAVGEHEISNLLRLFRGLCSALKDRVISELRSAEQAMPFRGGRRG